MTGHMIEAGSTYAKREHSAEMGGGTAGLGFSEMVARTANLRKGEGSGKAKGELRKEIAAAVQRTHARNDGDGGPEYPEHVYESIEVMDEERVNIDAIAALVHHIDETRDEVRSLCSCRAWLRSPLCMLRSPEATQGSARYYLCRSIRPLQIRIS